MGLIPDSEEELKRTIELKHSIEEMAAYALKAFNEARENEQEALQASEEATDFRALRLSGIVSNNRQNAIAASRNYLLAQNLLKNKL